MIESFVVLSSWILIVNKIRKQQSGLSFFVFSIMIVWTKSEQHAGRRQAWARRPNSFSQIYWIIFKRLPRSSKLKHSSSVALPIILPSRMRATKGIPPTISCECKRRGWLDWPCSDFHSSRGRAQTTTDAAPSRAASCITPSMADLAWVQSEHQGKPVSAFVAAAATTINASLEGWSNALSTRAISSDELQERGPPDMIIDKALLIGNMFLQRSNWKILDGICYWILRHCVGAYGGNKALPQAEARRCKAQGAWRDHAAWGFFKFFLKFRRPLGRFELMRIYIPL